MDQHHFLTPFLCLRNLDIFFFYTFYNEYKKKKKNRFKIRRMRKFNKLVSKQVFPKFKISQWKFYSGRTSSVGMFVNCERAIEDTLNNYKSSWDVITAYEQLRLRGHTEIHACNLLLQNTPVDNMDQLKKLCQFIKHLGLSPDQDTQYFLGTNIKLLD